MPSQPIDEIEDFWKGRYLSTGEAAWRTLGFHITKKTPAVTALPIHLPHSTKRHQYQRSDGSASKLSLLDRYFLRPCATVHLPEGVRTFASLTYEEYYTHFRLLKFNASNVNRAHYFLEMPNSVNSPRMHVILRTSSTSHLTRIQHLRPSHGEVFYLRSILIQRPATSFQDARTVNNVVYSTFQDAATELGLYTDSSESTQTLLEAVSTLRTPRQLRWLFTDLLANDCIEFPLSTWDTFRDELCKDFLIQHSNVSSIAETCALQELQTFLTQHGKSLADYGLPLPTFLQVESMLEIERWSNNRLLIFQRAQESYMSLNDEQQHIFNLIWNAVEENTSLPLFMDGKAGTGKTTVITTLCDALRGMEKIVLPTATSAFAAQLYPGGRTTHSMFKVHFLTGLAFHHTKQLKRFLLSKTMK